MDQFKISRKNKWAYGIAIFTVIFLICSILFRIFDVDGLPAQLSGVLLEVVITAIVTVLLLNGQSATEEERDKNLRVFAKKQEVYHNFLANFKQIILDSEITIDTHKKYSNHAIDEVKDLIFELGYIQLHSNEKNTHDIFEEVTKIIRLITEFEQQHQHNEQQRSEFYSHLSGHLFKIISILKSDLYGEEIKEMDPKVIQELLDSCGIFMPLQNKK